MEGKTDSEREELGESGLIRRLTAHLSSAWVRGNEFSILNLEFGI